MDKTDAIDAFGIYKATFTASIPSIACRIEENQTLLNLLNVRAQFSKQLIQTQNAHRALLYELGVICNEGLKAVTAASDEKSAEAIVPKSIGGRAEVNKRKSRRNPTETGAENLAEQ